MRRSVVLLCLVAALLDPGPAVAATPAWFPTRLTHLGDAQQALVMSPPADLGKA